MMRIAIARGLSFFGHPILLVPIAAAFHAIYRSASTAIIIAATGAAAAISASALLYVFLQVRSGRWTDSDATAPEERLQLNAFLLIVFLGGAGVLWWADQPWQIPVGLAIAGVIIASALALRSLLKISLHSAFAVFAASLLWPNVALVVLLLLLSGAIAWSRLALNRHTFAEVVSGLVVGALAGGCLIGVGIGPSLI